MVRILILEDNSDSRMALAAIIKNNFKQIEIYSAASTEDAEKQMASCLEMHLFLLDINLNSKKVDDTDGLAFAKKLRDVPQYAFTPIVFITSLLSMELAAYREIQCYRYITKPFEEADVINIIHKVLTHSEEEEKRSILVKKDGVNYKIACGDIVYIQAIARGVRLCMKKEQIDIRYLTLKQLLPRLPEQEFIQCHREFIVNWKYMEYIDFVSQMIKMVSYKEPVEIGVTYKNKIRSLMHEPE